MNEVKNNLHSGETKLPSKAKYNESKAKILYKGRIDDSYARVGKRRRVTTGTELNDVLEAIKNNQPILTNNTPAVGCFIEKSKLN